jgi:hypothetical protein
MTVELLRICAELADNCFRDGDLVRAKWTGVMRAASPREEQVWRLAGSRAGVWRVLQAKRRFCHRAEREQKQKRA